MKIDKNIIQINIQHIETITKQLKHCIRKNYDPQLTRATVELNRATDLLNTWLKENKYE